MQKAMQQFAQLNLSPLALFPGYPLYHAQVHKPIPNKFHFDRTFYLTKCNWSFIFCSGIKVGIVEKMV